MTGATAWLAAAAQPLATSDPDAPLTDLEPLRGIVGEAAVVGVARGAHGSRELTELTHRLLRFHVEQLGFRTLAIEAAWTTGLEIDAWLQTGRGEILDRLTDTYPWWRSREFLAVLGRMRAHNVGHPEDPLRLIGLDADTEDMSALERQLAANVLRWRQHTGHRILYWSGSHSAVGHHRTVAWAPDEAGVTSRNAGSLLRERLGAAYVSTGLVFQHGTVDIDGTPTPVPTPPAEFTDAALAGAGPQRYLLDLRAARSEAARAITDAPLHLRLIGPRYDPDRPASMSGGALSEFFDAVLHIREVTPATPPP